MNKNENKKSLKKPLVLGGIAVLLTLIGITGGNTYAKYITSKSVPAQTATVAKFGFVITADADDLFNFNYSKANSDAVTMTKTTETDKTKLGVAGTTNLVAPGTEGSMTFTVSGSAEVATQLSFDMKNIAEVKIDNYRPVKWTLTKNTTKLVTDGALSDVSNALDTVTYNPGDVIADTYTLSWSWAFVGTETNANEMDTLLGYKSAGVSFANAQAYTGTEIDETTWNAASTTVKFDLGITVEQIAR